MCSRLASDSESLRSQNLNSTRAGYEERLPLRNSIHSRSFERRRYSGRSFTSACRCSSASSTCRRIACHRPPFRLSPSSTQSVSIFGAALNPNRCGSGASNRFRSSPPSITNLWPVEFQTLLDSMMYGSKIPAGIESREPVQITASEA